MYIEESECIYCGACVVECPESAVINSGIANIEFNYEQKISAEKSSINTYYAINSDVCTGCPDQDYPLCYSICPMNCIKINVERLSNV